MKKTSKRRRSNPLIIGSTADPAADLDCAADRRYVPRHRVNRHVCMYLGARRRRLRCYVCMYVRALDVCMSYAFEYVCNILKCRMLVLVYGGGHGMVVAILGLIIYLW